mgnify:CR=1 FL=1
MKKLKTYFNSWFFGDGQDNSKFFVPIFGIDKIICRITPDEVNDILEFRLLDPEKDIDLNSGTPYKVKYPEGYLVKPFFSELLYSNIHYSYRGVYCSLFCGGEDIKEVASVYYNKKMVSSDSEHLFCFGSQNPFIEPELVYWSLRFWIMQNPQIANVHHFNLLNDIFPRTFSANYPGFGLAYTPYIDSKELKAFPTFIDLEGTERYTKHFSYTDSLFYSIGNKFRFVEERSELCLDDMSTAELKEAFLYELSPLLGFDTSENCGCRIDISPSLLKQAMEMLGNLTLLYNLTKLEKKAVDFLSEACMKNSPTLLSIYKHILNKRCNSVYQKSLTSYATVYLENSTGGPKVTGGRGGKQDIDTLKIGIYQARKLVESRIILALLIPYLNDIVKGLR